MERWSTVAPTTGEFSSLFDWKAANDQYYRWKVSGQKGEIPPTFLGVLIDEPRSQVVRQGFPTVEFGGHHIPWRLFLCMFRHGTAYCSATNLLEAVWNKWDVVIDVNVQRQLSALRGIIKPLGLTVANQRLVGYRLEKSEQTHLA